MSDQHDEQQVHNPISTVVMATNNKGKVREIEALLDDLGWQWRHLDDLVLPEETGATFEENAALKACSVCMSTGLPALADDSGLEVRALHGEPGVYSSRFGNRKNDLERNVFLLERLRKQEDRYACFVSVVVLAYPDGHMETYKGTVEGEILHGPRGDGGFGYDPLFLPAGHTRTMAEMTLPEKQILSHRGIALRALREAHLTGEALRNRPSKSATNRLD